MVRPENVRVLVDGATADTTLEGTVADVIMLGGVTRTIVKLDTGGDDLGQEPDERARARRRGARVRLGWAAADTVLLPRDTTRPGP